MTASSTTFRTQAPDWRPRRLPTPPSALTDPAKRLSPKMVLVGPDAEAVKETGGRAIYEFRAHPRKQPWEKAADETRASYRARMQELANALAAAGFVIRRR